MEGGEPASGGHYRTSQTKLIDQLAKDNKITSDLAEQAKADYKQSQALYDVDNAFKASTKGRAGVPEVTDPNAFANRITKLYDSGRLQQAAGGNEELANQLRNHGELLYELGLSHAASN